MAATNQQQAAALELRKRNDDIILKKPSFVVGKRWSRKQGGRWVVFWVSLIATLDRPKYSPGFWCRLAPLFTAVCGK